MEARTPIGVSGSSPLFLFFFIFLKFSETLDMSSKQLGEMYEGDSADTCTGKFPLGGSRVHRPGSEDPQSALAEILFNNIKLFLFIHIDSYKRGSYLLNEINCGQDIDNFSDHQPPQ